MSNVPDGFDWSDPELTPTCPRCELILGRRFSAMRWVDMDEEFECASCWLTIAGMTPDEIEALTIDDLEEMGAYDPTDYEDGELEPR